MSTPASLKLWGAGRLGGVLPTLALAAVIYAVHGESLEFQLFMDDYAHFRQLQECDWSFVDLTQACRLELIGSTAQLWWLPDCTLRFFRPVAFGLMKLTYAVSGWSPTVMHAASLVWHLVASGLLLALLRRCGASLWLAWAVAALFAIHPGHVATVQWIACQTELMVTVFLLGATLCFGRFRGWPGFAGADGPPTGPGVGWAVGSAVLFAAALGCRENAVMFPFIVAACEPVARRTRRRAALWLYAVFGLLIVAYTVVRWQTLGGAALPPRPYVMPANDPGFVRYIFDKTCYYLLGEFLMVPCVPLVGVAYLRVHPLVFYGATAGAGLFLVGVATRFFRRPPGLLGPAWLVGFLLPVLPVFEAPHHLYLPGVGWAVALMLVLRGLGAAAPTAARWVRYGRSAAMWTVVLAIAGLFLRAATWAGMALRAANDVERTLCEELAATPHGLQDGDTLYVANLPLIGHYARLGVEAQTGRRGLRVIPLTWSPRILGLATPAELTWVADQTVVVRVAGDRYFAGAFGRIVAEFTGAPVPNEVDCRATCGFRVTVLERDAEGIKALRFDFDRPPYEGGRHLFWSSRARLACEVFPPPGTPSVQEPP